MAKHRKTAKKRTAKKRAKKRTHKGQIPMHVLIKRYDSLGRLLKKRGFKE